MNYFSKEIKLLRKMTSKLDWEKFHTPENLAKSIIIEASELLECFQWGEDWRKIDRVELKHELADVLIYCLMFSDCFGFDLSKIVREKIELNKRKYEANRK